MYIEKNVILSAADVCEALKDYLLKKGVIRELREFRSFSMNDDDDIIKVVLASEQSE